MDAAADVHLFLDRISRADCRKLEDVLSDWARWRKEHPEQQGSSDAQLMRGSLRLDVARFVNEGVLIWHDTLAVVPGAAQHLTGADDEMPEVPMYDRGTAELLAPAFVDSTLLLPGGAAAAKRRQLAQANVGEWTEGALYEGTDELAPTRKRQRVMMGKCHNCGSYAHGLAKCPVPVDQKRVSAAMAEARAERQGAKNPMAQLRLRYFDSAVAVAAAAKGDAHPAPQPGQISAELATAVGMPSLTAPPPWLARMVVLGVPPAYGEKSLEDEEAEEEVMVFYRGSDDEADRDGGDGAPGPEAGVGAGGAGGDSSSSSDDPDDSGFIPFEGAAGEDAQAEQGPAVQEPQQQQQEQQQQLEGQPPEPVCQKCPAAAIVFPGVGGAELPPNANAAWTQALKDAAWLQTQM